MISHRNGLLPPERLPSSGTRGVTATTGAGSSAGRLPADREAGPRAAKKVTVTRWMGDYPLVTLAAGLALGVLLGWFVKRHR
jgi:hypothetical protein